MIIMAVMSIEIIPPHNAVTVFWLVIGIAGHRYMRITPPHNAVTGFVTAFYDGDRRVNLCYAFRRLPQRYLPLRLALYPGEPALNF